MKVDIRKIYVCKIQEVVKVYKEETDEDEYSYVMGRRVYNGKKIRRLYELDENNVSYGLFVKGLAGYKHILTGTKYKMAGGLMNRGEYVINPNSVELFVKRELALVSHVIDKCQSFDVNVDVIKVLEESINVHDSEVEEELSKQQN